MQVSSLYVKLVLKMIDIHKFHSMEKNVKKRVLE